MPIQYSPVSMWPKPKLQPSSAASRRRAAPSISHSNPVKAGIRSGTRWSGGKAALAKAPQSAATPWRRQPRSPARPVASRAGHPGRFSGRAGSAVTFDIGKRRGGWQVAHPQPFDPARIGLQDFEADPARLVQDELAPGRNAIRKIRDQPA